MKNWVNRNEFFSPMSKDIRSTWARDCKSGTLPRLNFFELVRPSGYKVGPYVRPSPRGGGQQGCQMVYFQTPKIPIWVFCGGPLIRKCWYILLPFGLDYVRSFGIFYWAFGNLVVIWYSFTRFGMLCQEKSGNPGGQTYSPQDLSKGANTGSIGSSGYHFNPFVPQSFLWANLHTYVGMYVHP
jgi:hypothetical protein